MANNLFMEIDGIPGESEQDGYEGLVQIESWSWAMDQEGSAHRGGGSGTGRVDVCIPSALPVNTSRKLSCIMLRLGARHLST